jgi:protein-disulfide isomerase
VVDTSPSPTPGDAVADTSPSPTTALATETVESQSPTSAEQQPLPVDADDWHVLGSPDAAVTIIEYSDFQ